MRDRALIITVAVAAAVLLPVAAAPADGGPPFGLEAGPSGVTAPGAVARYVTLRVGRNTILQRVQRSGGRVLAWRSVRGRYAVPMVAMDGTPGGLSAREQSLVLVRPQRSFPIARTRMALVDPATLRVRRLTLRGDFTFDAISPDGATLFLVQYVSPSDPTRYAVRAYDLGRRRLLRGAIVDRREPDEKMSGVPLTRITSTDGRWAYTLYDGNGKTPFVHALDTTARRAYCIDLPVLRGSRQLWGLRLALGGPGLQVMDGAEPMAVVDTKTLRVVDGSAVRRSARRHPASAGDGVPWVLLLGGAGVLVASAGGVVVLGTRRRRTVITSGSESRPEDRRASEERRSVA